MPEDTIADTSAPVDEDLRCPGCGYNVRGLPESGKCPECATPVWTARGHGRLDYADPGWLAKLRSGARWIGSVLLLALLVAAIGGIGGVLAQLAFGSAGFERFGATVLVGGLCVAPILLLVGSWKITTRNPAEAGSEPRISPRRAARLAMFVCTLDVLLTVALYHAGVRWTVLGSLNALASPIGVAGAAGAWGLTRHLEDIARHGADDFARRQAVLYRRGFLLSWFTGAVGAVGASIGLGQFAVLLFAAGLFVVGFGALILLMPIYLIDRLEESVAAARSTREPGALPPRPPDAVSSPPGKA